MLLLEHLQLTVYRLHAYVVSAKCASAAAHIRAPAEAANAHVECGEVLTANAEPMPVCPYKLVEWCNRRTVVGITAATALLSFTPARVAFSFTFALATITFPTC